MGRKTGRTKAGPDGHFAAAAARGFSQALDAHAYEIAYEALKDPDVQDALDALMVRIVAAFRKRRRAQAR